MKNYKAINVYFDMRDKAQKDLYNKLNKLDFLEKIESKSKFMRETVAKAVKKL